MFHFYFLCGNPSLGQRHVIVWHASLRQYLKTIDSLFIHPFSLDHPLRRGTNSPARSLISETSDSRKEQEMIGVEMFVNYSTRGTLPLVVARTYSSASVHAVCVSVSIGVPSHLTQTLIGHFL